MQKIKRVCVYIQGDRLYFNKEKRCTGNKEFRSKEDYKLIPGTDSLIYNKIIAMPEATAPKT